MPIDDGYSQMDIISWSEAFAIDQAEMRRTHHLHWAPPEQIDTVTAAWAQTLHKVRLVSHMKLQVASLGSVGRDSSLGRLSGPLLASGSPVALFFVPPDGSEAKMNTSYNITVAGAVDW